MAAAAKAGRFEHTVQRMRDERTDKETFARARAELVEAGVEVIDRDLVTWPVARLDSNYGPPLGRAARGPCGARRGRRARRAGGGEASQSGRWLAEGVGRVWGGTRAAGRAVVARVAFVRDCLGAPAASRPA